MAIVIVDVRRLARFLISGRAFIRLKIECYMEHGRNKLVFLLAIASLPAWNADRFTYFIGAVAKQ